MILFVFLPLCITALLVEGHDRPIIGILSQELTDKMAENYGPHKSFIASSYVQKVHGAGARAVPILLDQSEEYYRDILQYLNGVLLPGGSVWFYNKTTGYVEAGRKIMKYADAMNSKGDYFPIWGTCLGFQLLTFLDNDEGELRTLCEAYNRIDPLILTPDAANSRIFAEASAQFLIYLTMNTTYNLHHFCITPDAFKKSNMYRNWRVLTTNEDDFGLEYISTIEHKTKPYYGVQWHPEKPIYEWGHFVIPHDQYAVRVSQYMANFFINQARKSNHSFPSEDVERQYLIYKYIPTFGHATSTYTQLYFFDD